MTEIFRTWAEINLDALEKNVLAMRSLLHGKKMMAVIKANAYGHGAVCVARELSEKVDMFAVATLEEAVELRRNGCEKDILVLGPLPPTRLDAAVGNDIMTVVFSASTAKELCFSAKKLKKRARVFLSVDTGMGRIGLSPDKAGILEAKEICSEKELDICGVMTHYACADCACKASVQRQREKFDGFLSEMKKEGISFPVVSAGNTAATLDGDEPYDMVRVGLALCGMYPSEFVNREAAALEPVLSLKTRVTQIKTVPKGTAISYGHACVTKRMTRVATLSAGYADGVPRELSGRGRILVGGKYAGILGRICMDQMMVDVSDIDGVRVGDTATVIGRDGARCISADDVALEAGTISYDIVCRISLRVPRVYLRGGEICEVLSYI